MKFNYFLGEMKRPRFAINVLMNGRAPAPRRQSRVSRTTAKYLARRHLSSSSNFEFHSSAISELTRRPSLFAEVNTRRWEDVARGPAAGSGPPSSWGNDGGPRSSERKRFTRSLCWMPRPIVLVSSPYIRSLRPTPRWCSSSSCKYKDVPRPRLRRRRCKT